MSIEVTDIRSGRSSFSGKETNELWVVNLNGQEQHLTFAELRKFGRMQFRKPAQPKGTPLFEQTTRGATMLTGNGNG